MIATLRFTTTWFAIGAAAVAMANRRADAAVRQQRWLKFGVYVAVVHGMLLAAVAGRAALLAVTITVIASGSVELRRATANAAMSGRFTAWAVFAVASGGTLLLVTREAPSRIGFLYIVVALFDGMSQAGGHLAGQHALAPRVSPGKTLEGFIVGVAGAVLGSWWLRVAAALTAPMSIVTGVAVAVTGLGGDLAASWVKRRAGLKDFGRILPGHGGVLDRFDSFLAAAASFALAGLISRYV